MFRGSPSPLKFSRFRQNPSKFECPFNSNLLSKYTSVWVHFYQDEELYDFEQLISKKNDEQKNSYFLVKDLI